MAQLCGQKMPKTPEEEVGDHLLLLYLINKAQTTRSLWGRTKLEKLVYCSQYSMMKDGIKGFNYYFYRWKFGPFSDEIYKDIDQLSSGKLIVKGAEDFRVTPLGSKILEDCKELLNLNRDITRHIDEVVSDFKDYDADRITGIVYEMTVFGEKERRVKDVKPREELLSKLSAEKARVAFRMTKEELATLDIFLDAECYRSVMQASESAKRKPLIPLDEVL